VIAPQVPTPRFMSTAAAMTEAFSRIATNVAVITTACDGEQPHGATANVWAEPCQPPLLLLTLRATGQTLSHIERSKRFAVNVLNADQADLASQFAGARENRFREVIVTRGPFGQPLLAGSLATFECRLRAMHPFGDYRIVVGEAVHSKLGAGDPLLYFRSRFRVPSALEPEQSS
jgi:flavin reductase (DIM6/NTAB) family NADH-FMN oxidoreductase RutF